jgi:hypothetical protein
MSDYLPLLKSKHNSMALLLAHPEFYPEEAEWRGRYVWLLRSSLEALGEPLTPQEDVRAYRDEEALRVQGVEKETGR